ncbi:hypothetical protein L1049_027247 [Liquidambar formosana]|uniref:Uncharacterized protein n=1 Tax=Liquidambar formosana TaxID=63359 RepID=A0AAP0QX67_LIQFO
MGSCISKCRPRPKKCSKSHEECDSVQDKLVISQAPTSPLPLSNTKASSSPSPSPSSSSTNSSFSSFSCSNSTTSISCSSSASSSSILSSKDRSFSNEFLWSCVKENPHIIRVVDHIKANSIKPVPAKIHAQKLDSPAKLVAPPARQSIPQRVVGSSAVPQKRARASSPTLTRQKSFRKEPERPNTGYSAPCRTMRSPSPSRRFTGDNCRNVGTNTPKESCCKRSVGSRTNSVNPVSSLMWKENLRPASPCNNSSRHSSYLKNREMLTHQIGSKSDEVAIGELLSNMDVDALPMEDIDNPHISLDCFIFL